MESKQAGKPKRWYLKWWGILVIVLSVLTLTFPIVLMILLWQNDKLDIKSKIAATVVFVFVVISSIISSF